MSELTTERTYYLDRNHSGVRATVMLSLVVLTVLVTYVVLPPILTLLGWDSLILIFRLFLGLFIAVFINMGVEWLLTKYWRSGSELHITDDEIVVAKVKQEPVAYSFTSPIDLQTWYFEVRKSRSYAPRGSFATTIRFSQGGHSTCLYSFLKPDIKDDFPEWYVFSRLLPEKSSKKDTEREIYDLQSDLRVYERERWLDGVEMLPADFIELLDTLKVKLPGWP